MRVPCTFKIKNASAPRLQPWYDEKPSEEQLEEIKKITKQHVAMASGGDSEGAPLELVERAKKLQWPDTSTMNGKKEAAKLMVELCTSGEMLVDLPQDEKKAIMSIGKVIVGNPDAATSATETLELVVKEFGITSKKRELAERQKDAMASTCACATNAGVMQAFLELADLYLKEGNRNACGTVSVYLNPRVFSVLPCLLICYDFYFGSYIKHISTKRQRLQLWRFHLK